MTSVDIDDLFRGVEQLVEDANNDPECIKCQKPITELDQVRIVIVRIDGEPVSAWVHAKHSKPGDPVGLA